MKINVIFENEDYLVLDKPAGVVVNRADTIKQETLQDWFEKLYPNLFKGYENSDTASAVEFINRSGMVHRLDKDTGGALVWAKNPQTMFFLMKQFKLRQIQKGYLALVHGQLEPKQAVVSLPLGRVPHNRKQFGVIPGGKESQTKYKVVEYIKPSTNHPEGFSLVALVPKTGRTHQLRVILKHLGHPIVGDSHYLSKKRIKSDRNWCPRQFLHAQHLCFFYQEKKNCYQSSLAPDLIATLETIKSYV